MTEETERVPEYEKYTLLFYLSCKAEVPRPLETILYLTLECVSHTPFSNLHVSVSLKCHANKFLHQITGAYALNLGCVQT